MSYETSGGLAPSCLGPVDETDHRDFFFNGTRQSRLFRLYNERGQDSQHSPGGTGDVTLGPSMRMYVASDPRFAWDRKE